jgi:2,3-diketo-5-methylthio-1-phosphopentane phosphatase
MWSSCNLDWNQAMALLKDVRIDPEWDNFYQFCQASGIPITVLSAGLFSIVNMFLQKYAQNSCNPSGCQILANDILIKPEHWQIVFRDDTEHGHDKGQALRNAKQQYPGRKTVFIGDGVSDISAAREADFVFAKRGKDLEAWCVSNGVNYVPFDGFDAITNFLRNA